MGRTAAMLTFLLLTAGACASPAPRQTAAHPSPCDAIRPPVLYSVGGNRSGPAPSLPTRLVVC